MENRKILIVGICVAAIVWCATLWFSRLPEDASPKGNPPSSPPAQSSSVPTPAPAPVPAEEAKPLPAKPVVEPRLNTSGKIPRPPRKAMAEFHDVGEICVEAETGQRLAGRNFQAQCPPASVVKLMTLYVVFDAISKGELSLDETIIASPRASSMGGTQLYLAIGEPCRVEDLIYGLMLQSANDAAVALAERVSGSVENFVARMNKTAQELGMTRTKLRSPHGLPLSRKEKAAGEKPDLTTAEDLAKLSVALLKKFPQTFKYSATVSKNFPADEKRPLPLPMTNHNKLLQSFEGCDGLKTGWTNDGASIVTTASRGNKRVIAVVLGGLVKNKKGEIDAKTSQRERNQRAAELMYSGLRDLDVLKYEPTPNKGE